ncbi:hypothetical protein WR25_26754 [Diploscapter pachys]|uniref:Uncharacterized protein n=1 Tax=Diploscapter pachys TaxID=2018661 RepID=A0A2A2JMQ1_9BILA|nr:hypothetical protein WR25_26754 [Diploscapter pachys]
MQNAMNRDIGAAYSSVWSQLEATWEQLKQDVVNAGVERDWRNLWEKLTGTVEPYLSVFGEHLGKLANTFIRQQQLRYRHQMEVQKNLVQGPYGRYRSPRGASSKEDNSEDNSKKEI